MSDDAWDIDAGLGSADWTKQGWDLPPYGSAAFLAAIGGPDKLDAFRTLPAYRHAVEQGLIHDDEWVGDYITFPGSEGVNP